LCQLLVSPIQLKSWVIYQLTEQTPWSLNCPEYISKPDTQLQRQRLAGALVVDADDDICLGIKGMGLLLFHVRSR
jgi:hypothetical protein